jgi:hypothetical protein
MSEPDVPFPVTPDGRYFVVRGRLWRMTNPDLEPEVRQALVTKLMEARRRVGICGRRGDLDGQRQARARVDEAKRGLGERGPVWWQDGSPDENRRMGRNTSYAAWFGGLKKPFP